MSYVTPRPAAPTATTGVLPAAADQVSTLTAPSGPMMGHRAQTTTAITAG